MTAGPAGLRLADGPATSPAAAPPPAPPGSARMPTAPPRLRPEALSDTSDEALVALVADGDRAAYAALVDRHLDRTLAVARRVLGDRTEAEDVAQEAFLRLWRDAGRFRPEMARFGTWFYRIAMNLCLDRARRQRPSPLEAAGDPADPAPDPAARLDDSRTRAAVAGAVSALPERLRTAVLLTYDAGLSNAEAAAAMDIGVKALESLLVRARKTLRERLAAWRAGDAEGGVP